MDPAALTVEVLGFLAADPDRLERFLDLTGLSPQTLRRTAAQSGFAESLLDYLCGDDRLLTAFAAEHDRDPTLIEAARQRLQCPRDTDD